MAKQSFIITLLLTLAWQASDLSAVVSPQQMVIYLFQEITLDQPEEEIPSIPPTPDAFYTKAPKPTSKPAQQPAAQQPTVVYVPYNPQTQTPPAGSYIYQPQTQAPQPVPQQAQDSGPQVGEVMGAFVNVLGGIVAMGMGAEYGDSEQEMAGLNMFINSGAQLIAALTRKSCTPEQFSRAFIKATRRLAHEQHQE